MTGRVHDDDPADATPVDATPVDAARVDAARVDLAAESPERGLVALVLTVVELLRQLMERQALRRMDEGDLVDEQIERMGACLMALDERMDWLCEHFDLTRNGLNLDLGPLGQLLADDRATE